MMECGSILSVFSKRKGPRHDARIGRRRYGGRSSRFNCGERGGEFIPAVPVRYFANNFRAFRGLQQRFLRALCWRQRLADRPFAEPPQFPRRKFTQRWQLQLFFGAPLFLSDLSRLHDDIGTAGWRDALLPQPGGFLSRRPVLQCAVAMISPNNCATIRVICATRLSSRRVGCH